jgi:two-component system response regulator PilR (NtrC family)
MDKKLIFVVDDDPVMRQSLQRYLSQIGFDVKAAVDGFDVLVMLEYFKPDLIIADIRMPKLDGISLLQGIRNRELTSHIPVIFMSGCSSDDILVQARELGAKFFLFKPFPLNYLAELIASILPQEQAAQMEQAN